MGHIAPASARRLVEEGIVTGLALDPDSKEEHCDACIYARATRQPVPKLRISPQASDFGDEIHSDVWGPSQVSTRRGRRFFITFTDDATRYTVAYLLPAKGDAFNAYRSFEAWARTQNLCNAIKVLRSDRGGEYLSAAFDKHLADTGTAHRLTAHDSPHLNGIAERLNRTLMEKVRALLHTSGLPHSLWGEALRHSTWLKNRTSTRALGGKTPWQALYHAPPNLAGLKRFGETVWVHDPTGSKLDVRAWEGRWLGFDVESHAHRVYCPAKATVAVERNVYFGAAQQLEGEHIDVPSSSDFRELPAASQPPAAPAQQAPAAPPAPAPVPPQATALPRRAPAPPPPPRVPACHPALSASFSPASAWPPRVHLTQPFHAASLSRAASPKRMRSTT